MRYLKRLRHETRDNCTVYECFPSPHAHTHQNILSFSNRPESPKVLRCLGVDVKCTFWCMSRTRTHFRHLGMRVWRRRSSPREKRSFGRWSSSILAGLQCESLNAQLRARKWSGSAAEFFVIGLVAEGRARGVGGLRDRG